MSDFIVAGVLGSFFAVAVPTASGYDVALPGGPGYDAAPPNPTGRSLIIVVDTSGSMDTNDPQRLCYDACHVIAGMAEEGDNVGVVCFDTRARVALPLQSVTEANRLNIQEMIAHGFSRTGRNTNFAAGLALAAEMRDDVLELERRLESGVKAGAHLVLFMSDGEHNVPNRTSYDKTVVPALEPFTDGGWPIHAVCFTQSGKGEGRRDLRDMAERTGGAFFFAEDANALFERFQGLARSFWGLMSVRNTPAAVLFSEVTTLHCLGRRNRGQPSIGELTRNGHSLDAGQIREYPGRVARHRAGFDLWSVDDPKPGAYAAKEINGGEVISFMARPNFQWVIAGCRVRSPDIEVSMRVQGDHATLERLLASGDVRTRLVPVERDVSEDSVEWDSQMANPRFDKEGALVYSWTIRDVDVRHERDRESFRLDVNYAFHSSPEQSWDLGSQHRSVTVERVSRAVRFVSPQGSERLSSVGAMRIELMVVERVSDRGERPVAHALLSDQAVVRIANEDSGEEVASLTLHRTGDGERFVGSFSSEGYTGIVLPGTYRLTGDVILKEGMARQADLVCRVADWGELDADTLRLMLLAKGEPLAGQALPIALTIDDRKGNHVSIGDDVGGHWRVKSAEFCVTQEDQLGMEAQSEVAVGKQGEQASVGFLSVLRCSGKCELLGTADVVLHLLDETGKEVHSVSTTLRPAPLMLDVAPRVELTPRERELAGVGNLSDSREVAFAVESWFAGDTTLAIWLTSPAKAKNGENPLPGSWFTSPGHVTLSAVRLDGGASTPGTAGFAVAVSVPPEERSQVRSGIYRGVVCVGEGGIMLASADIVFRVPELWPDKADFDVVCVPPLPIGLAVKSDIVVWENEQPEGVDLPSNHHLAQLRYCPQNQTLCVGSTVAERFVVKKLVWDWPEPRFVRYEAEGVSPRLHYAMASFWDKEDATFKLCVKELVLGLKRDEGISRTYTDVSKSVSIGVE